jgi:hypothetical protein
MLHTLLDALREGLAAHREYEQLVAKGMRHDNALRAAVSATSHSRACCGQGTPVRSAFLIVVDGVRACIELRPSQIRTSLCGGRSTGLHETGGMRRPPRVAGAACSLQRRTLLGGLAALAASPVGGNELAAAAIEQNTLKRRGIGLRACDPERASPGFTLFAPHFVENRNVYLIDLQGEVAHAWKMPYPPGLSGYLTERGTLFYNGRTQADPSGARFARRRNSENSKANRIETMKGPAESGQSVTSNRDVPGECCIFRPAACWLRPPLPVTVRLTRGIMTPPHPPALR